MVLRFMRLGLTVTLVFGLLQGSSAQTCELITEKAAKDFCGDWFGYNMTSLRDFTPSQRHAATDMMQFKPLIEVACSPTTKIFICSFYFPMCVNSVAKQGIPPCRSLCLHTRKNCGPIMARFGYRWPKAMECGQFPVFNTGQLCVSQNASPSKSSAVTTYNLTRATLRPTVPAVPKVSKIKKGKGLKRKQKKCSQGSNHNSKRCCRYGRKVLKINTRSTCLLSDNISRRTAQGRKLLKKAQRYCSQNEEAKKCYESCCLYKKKPKKQKKRRNGIKKRRP